MNKKLLAIAISVIALTITLASLSTGNIAAPAQDSKAFVGTWERISYKDDEGKAIEDRLVRAHLIFSAEGHYSQVQLPTGRAKNDKPLKEMTKEELLNRFEGAVAYYGTYTISGNTLTRKEIVELNPNREGFVNVQTFRLGSFKIFSIKFDKGHSFEKLFFCFFVCFEFR